MKEEILPKYLHFRYKIPEKNGGKLPAGKKQKRAHLVQWKITERNNARIDLAIEKSSLIAHPD